LAALYINNTAKAVPIASIDSVHFVNKERLPVFHSGSFSLQKPFFFPQKTLPAVCNACKSGFFRQKSGKGP
jgi:hypothetical protein